MKKEKEVFVKKIDEVLKSKTTKLSRSNKQKLIEVKKGIETSDSQPEFFKWFAILVALLKESKDFWDNYFK